MRDLEPGIQIHDRTWAEGFANWKDATNLWQARSALVPFVKVVRDNKYYSLIRIVGETLIQWEERFAKTAVGWILRDISKHEKDFVIDFLWNYLKFFTSETLRNTTKHFDIKEQNK